LSRPEEDDAKVEENSPLAQRLDQRLTALRQELQAGQKMLVDLDARRLDVQQTLLRIGGAVRVLEELLAAEPAAVNGAASPATADTVGSLTGAESG
jgi:hypothetical protein